MSTETSKQSGWHRRHASARIAPHGAKEKAIVYALDGWIAMATASNENGYKMSEEGYFGDDWAAMAKILISYLSCDFGTRLDGGTLWSEIADTLAAEGFDPEEILN